MNLLLFAMAAIGLTNIIVDSSIMEKPREWFEKRKENWLAGKVNSIMSCYQCAGFWAGVICGCMLLLTPEFAWVAILLYGFAGSFAAVIAIHVYNYLEALAVVNLPEEDDAD